MDKNTVANPNNNYSIFINKLSSVINKFIKPLKTRFNKRKHPKTDWITRGIIKYINFRDKLYAKLRATPQCSQDYNTFKTNLNTYNKILKNNIRMAKSMYFNSRLQLVKMT